MKFTLLFTRQMVCMEPSGGLVGGDVQAKQESNYWAQNQREVSHQPMSEP